MAQGWAESVAPGWGDFASGELGKVGRFESGYIKWHRRAFAGDIGDNINCLAVWVALLSMATWKQTKILWEGKQRELPPGSVVFGITELSSRWECSKNTISKWLRYLQTSDRISLETCPRGCIATIRNWEEYQLSDDEGRTPSEHKVNTARTQGEHSENLSEEGNKSKKRRSNTAEHPLVGIWNQYRGPLPAVRGCSGQRRTYADARWGEHPSTEYWGEVITRMTKSAFCRGEKNKPGPHENWKADFDFLVTPGRDHKIIEGKYDDRSASQSQGSVITEKTVIDL